MEPATQQPPDRELPPSIIAVALVEGLGALPFLCLSGIVLMDLFHSAQSAWQPRVLYAFGLSFLFGLAAAASAIGLLFLREWARITTLYLATLPFFACSLFVMLYEPVRNDPFLPFAKILLAILVPVSIWWWILFTRPSVRSQFHRNG